MTAARAEAGIRGTADGTLRPAFPASTDPAIL